MLAGVDEAGRGPVVGPMVIAAVAGDEGIKGKLLSMGVKDSKALTPRKREALAPRVTSMTKSVLFVVPPEVIDRNVKKSKGNLNELEVVLMAEAISCLKPDLAVVDALGSERKFADRLSSLTGLKVEARHDADSTCAFAAAASILAKVVRDRLVGCVIGAGSGYPSDPKTRAFLASVGKAPSFVRKSWGGDGVGGLRVPRQVGHRGWGEPASPGLPRSPQGLYPFLQPRCRVQQGRLPFGRGVAGGGEAARGRRHGGGGEQERQVRPVGGLRGGQRPFPLLPFFAFALCAGQRRFRFNRRPVHRR